MALIPFTETVKNTVEFIYEIYKIQNLNFEFLKSSLNLLKNFGIYILSFQWIFDFIKYPIYAVSESENIFSDLSSHFFNYQLASDLNFVPFENKNIFSFLNGFLDCFFLYLPFSPVHLIWLRRMFIEGQRSGRAATIGLICGNLSFLGFCLFGFRDFINIWFGFEFLSYFLNIWLIFVIIFEMTNYSSRTLFQVRKLQFWKVSVTTFLLVWTDQPGIYQFIGNLSLSTGVTPLDFSNITITIILYFLGTIIGSFFWTSIISHVALNCNPIFLFISKWLPFYNYTYYGWVKGFNRFCLIGCVTLTLTSLPFYGFDYLVLNPFGFSSQDHIWEKVTPFLLKLKATAADTRNRGRLGEKSSYHSVDTDFSLFDRGRYSGGPPVEFDIESLNYQSEYAWRSRFDRISSRNLSKTGGLLNRYLNEQLGPVEDALKKQRREKRQTEQIKRVKKIQKQKKKNLRIEEEPSLYNIDVDFIEPNEFLIARFIEDYIAEANKHENEVPDLPDELMANFSAMSEIAKYGFDLFSIFEFAEGDPLDDEIAAELKQKYSDNLLYKFIVNCDIRNFMRRQPYRLSTKDEIELFKNRIALGEYYDTLRSYSKLPTSFESLFCGPKSYSNRIYNQQFKGTLKILERLFAVNLEIEENIPVLESEKPKEQEIFLKDVSILKFDQPLYKKNLKNPLLHEQLLKYFPFLLVKTDFIPFINEEQPLPFFVGWDNEKRQFIVTNRFLTNEKTLTNIKLTKKNFQKLFFQKTQSVEKNQKPNTMNFTFTTWPVSNRDEFYKNSTLSRLYRKRGDIDFSELEGEDLFEYVEPPLEDETIVYETLPNLVQRIDLKIPEKRTTSLIPLRGGFVWPGNLPLKLKLKFNIKEQFITSLFNLIHLLKKFSLWNFK